MQGLSAVLWVRMNPAVGPVVFGRFFENELGDFNDFCIFSIFTSNIGEDAFFFDGYYFSDGLVKPSTGKGLMTLFVEGCF